MLCYFVVLIAPFLSSPSINKNTKDLVGVGGEIKHTPSNPQRQGPGHETCLTFARHCSCSIYW